MRMFPFIILLLCLLHCAPADPISKATQKVPTTIQAQMTRLTDLGNYVKAVKLEQTHDSIVGVISEVKTAANGDLLVADYRSAEKVFRFSPEGKFITRYGGIGQGPGEYENLQAFAALDDGRVVLLGAYRILLFAADGTLLNSGRLGVAAHWVETRGSRIYIYATNGSKPLENTILVYDENLYRVDEFHPYDRRIDRHNIKPRHGLTASTDTLFISDFYEFRISAYDFDGNPKHYYRFPSENQEVSQLWKQEVIEKKELLQLARSLHRINSLYALNHILLFTEVHIENNVFRLNLLDTKTNTLTRYPNIILMAEEDPGYLAMSDLVGQQGDTLIGTYESSQQFQKYKEQHQALATVDFSDDDNALLLFFKLKAVTDDPNNSYTIR